MKMCWGHRHPSLFYSTRALSIKQGFWGQVWVMEMHQGHHLPHLGSHHRAGAMGTRLGDGDVLAASPAAPHLDVSPAYSRQVSECPAGTEEPRHAPGAGRGHVARVGKEAITITLHSASNLPATREGRVPWPYVIV